MPLEIPSEIAVGLGLSESPQCRHIGYWRDTEDNSDGYAHREADGARRDLAQFMKSGRSPCGSTDEGYLRGCVEQSDSDLKMACALPWPGDHLDPMMPEEERARQAKALFAHNKTISVRYVSQSWDRLDWPDGQAKPWDCFGWSNGLGSGEVGYCGWVWPEGLFRYVQRYGLVLPDEFLVHVGAGT